MVGCGNSKFWRGAWVNLEPDANYPAYRDSYFQDCRDTEESRKNAITWQKACGTLWYTGKWQLFCEDCLYRNGFLW